MDRTTGSVIAAIPARWGSTRFPGKALAPLAGVPMIAHVVRRAASAELVDRVVVATDDERIAAAVRNEPCQVVMTGECSSGTDRVAQAVLDRDDWSLVVNVQGDEPLLSGRNVDLLVRGMLSDDSVGMGTLCRPLAVEHAGNPNAVKVVRTVAKHALYFSRALIPYPREHELAQKLWFLHLGIYAFRRAALQRFVSLPMSALEQAEALEQLRALENGIPILVLDAPDEAIGVDTAEDLRRVEEILTARGTSSP